MTMAASKKSSAVSLMHLLLGFWQAASFFLFAWRGIVMEVCGGWPGLIVLTSKQSNKAEEINQQTLCLKKPPSSFVHECKVDCSNMIKTFTKHSQLNHSDNWETLTLAYGSNLKSLVADLHFEGLTSLFQSIHPEIQVYWLNFSQFRK